MRRRGPPRRGSATPADLMRRKRQDHPDQPTSDHLPTGACRYCGMPAEANEPLVVVFFKDFRLHNACLQEWIERSKGS